MNLTVNCRFCTIVLNAIILVEGTARAGPRTPHGGWHTLLLGRCLLRWLWTSTIGTYSHVRVSNQATSMVARLSPLMHLDHAWLDAYTHYSSIVVTIQSEEIFPLYNFVIFWIFF